jgi:alpha-galactosidase
MGWNTYYGIGGTFDEKTIIDVADALVDRGLARAGYRICWLDYGWASGARGPKNGELLLDREQWPHGLRWLTDQLHARGLLAGIYTDAGPSGCEGQGVGSLGHYEQDADRFAAWGFDAVKIDFCGGGQRHLDPEPLFREFVRAVRGNSARRPMVVNVCNFWRPGQLGDGYPPPERSVYTTPRWASHTAESWRTDTDIGFNREVVFENVLRNLDTNARHGTLAGPGRWNDPDYLAPELGMTKAEARAQLTMWATVAAPLVVGADVRAVSTESVTMLTDDEVIAIDQDSLGAQGGRVKQVDDVEVWVKPLANRDRAVALLNRGSARQRIVAEAIELGLTPGGTMRARDVWAKTDAECDGALGADVPPRAAVLYRVTGAPGAGSVGRHE